MDMLGMLYLVRAAAATVLGRNGDAATSVARAVDLAGQTGDSRRFGMYVGRPNVHFWQIGIDADGRDADRALVRAQTINPAAIKGPVRQVFFYLDVARACTMTPGKDPQAVRYVLAVERIAPQHVHASKQVREIIQDVLIHSDGRQRVAEPALRGLAERLGLI